MFYVPLGVLLGKYMGSSFIWHRFDVSYPLPEGYLEQVTINAYLLKNLLPVTIGNIIGGAGLSMIYARVHRD